MTDSAHPTDEAACVAALGCTFDGRSAPPSDDHSPTVEITDAGPLLRLPAHYQLMVQGERCDQILEIVEGIVMLSRKLADGRRQVLELLGPGDLLAALEGHSVTAECISPVLVRKLGGGNRSVPTSLRDRLISQFGKRIAAMHELSLLVGRKSASERVATFLLAVAVRFGQRRGGTIVVPLDLTQADLGDHLGLGVETVCRELSKLRRVGALAPYRAGEIVILDERALARASEQTLPPKSYRPSQPRLRASRAQLAACSAGAHAGS